MDEATLKEKLRQYGSKTRCFCPSESKATRIKASLSSPSERSRARSAFLTVFSLYSLHQAREVHAVDQQVCLNPFMGELRSRREERNLNGVKNLLGARLFPNTLME